MIKVKLVLVCCVEGFFLFIYFIFFFLCGIYGHNTPADHISPSSWQSYQHHAGDLCCLLLPVVSTNNVLPLLLQSQVPFFMASEKSEAFLNVSQRFRHVLGILSCKKTFSVLKGLSHWKIVN